MATQNLANEISAESRNPAIPPEFPEFALLAQLQYNVELDTWTPKDLQQSTAGLSKPAAPTTISTTGDDKLGFHTKADDLLMLDDLPIHPKKISGRFMYYTYTCCKN